MLPWEVVQEMVGAVLVSHEIQSSQLKTARKEWGGPRFSSRDP